MKRGTIKRFREYLNEKFADSQKHRHNAFHQRTRGYGDYLYFQDRAMFDNELHMAEVGKDHHDFFRG